MTSETARAFWILSPGTGEIREAGLNAPGPGEVEIEALYSAISRGTETLVWRGLVPVSEFTRMRAPFQEGDFPGPVKYGYASVGRVRSGHPDWIGRTVFCLYPHQTRYVVPVTAVTGVPSAVPPARAVLAANLETAVNGIWDANPRIGDRVAVIGAGTVGCLVAWLASRLPGTEVELIDVDPGKRNAAEALGIRFAAPDSAAGDVDVVVHASGNPAGLSTGLELAGFEARIVELSWFGSAPVELALGQAFHSRRLTLVSSQVGHIASGQRGRWDHTRRMALVMRLLENAVLDALITDEAPFEELPDVMRRLAANGQAALCHRIAYR